MKNLAVVAIAALLAIVGAGCCASNKEEIQRQFDDLRMQIVNKECRSLLPPPPPLAPPPSIFAYMGKGGSTTQPGRR
jgi:hypothetical protein